MRATNFEVSGKTFTLAFPQDGIQQPATFINKGASRVESTTLTALARPIAGNPLADAVEVNLTVPVLVTDASTNVTTVKGLDRYKITARHSEYSSDDDKADGFALLVALLANEQVAAVLRDGERLV